MERNNNTLMVVVSQENYKSSNLVGCCCEKMIAVYTLFSNVSPLAFSEDVEMGSSRTEKYKAYATNIPTASKIAAFGLQLNMQLAL
ncbi:hypothetical protein Tco_0922998 [Tanacetum coccineum]|uniref:Uncharacterized protein n=1 Tax=Tanacetum coccineum TaxID=301880 RepID=A0ABQ5D646_9ASTR